MPQPVFLSRWTYSITWDAPILYSYLISSITWVSILMFQIFASPFGTFSGLWGILWLGPTGPGVCGGLQKPQQQPPAAEGVRRRAAEGGWCGCSSGHLFASPLLAWWETKIWNKNDCEHSKIRSKHIKDGKECLFIMTETTRCYGERQLMCCQEREISAHGCKVQ